MIQFSSASQIAAVSSVAAIGNQGICALLLFNFKQVEDIGFEVVVRTIVSLIFASSFYSQRSTSIKNKTSKIHSVIKAHSCNDV